MMSGWTVDWSVIGDAMLATGIKGALLLSGVLGLALLMREGSAARRHLVWTLGMVGLLALPFVQLGAPRWNVEVPWLEADQGPDAVDAVMGLAVVADEAAPADAVAPVVATVGKSAESEVDAVAAPAAVVAPAARSSAVGSAPAVAPVADTRIAPARRDEASIDWAILLFGVWGFGALLIGGSVVASHIAVRRLERSTRPFPGNRVAQELSRLAVLMDVGRPVRLLEGDEGRMPMSWGLLRPVILLPRGADRWPDARLRAVLLHELAHVQRRDCLTQFVAELGLALHWVNPLAWVAVWRLRVEREHACDDRVIEAGAQATAYADELLSLARGFRVAREGSLAAVAMARPSTLESRLRAVLAEGRRRTLTRRGAATTAGVALLLTTVVAGLSAVPATSDGPAAAESMGYSPDEPPVTAAAEVPSHDAGYAVDVSAETSTSATLEVTPSPALATAQALSCGTEQGGWDSHSHMRNNDDTRIEWSRRGCEVRVYMEGEVEFTSTFDDIARLDRGERFRIEEDDGSTERWLEITPGAGGAPEYEYRVNRDERPFDAEARAWYEDMLTAVFRRAGFMAEERVAAFLAEGGVAAVYQEMEFLQSDHVYARYVEETIRQAELSEPQLEELLDQSMDRVDSDHYMAEILGAVASQTRLNDRMLDTFISASRTLDSDHYRAQILETALDRGDLSNAQVRALLASASEIDSDHYQTEILTGVSDRYALQVDLRDAYLAAVERMDSDHYITEVLSGLLGRSDLGQDEKATVLRAAGRIESDHYVTEILEQLAGRGLETGPLREAYFEVAQGIESDHYAQNALQAILEHEAQLSASELTRLVEASRAIESDHYRSDLLVEIARRHRLEGATREAFMRAMEGIESQHYRGPVAEALLRNGG